VAKTTTKIYAETERKRFYFTKIEEKENWITDLIISI